MSKLNVDLLKSSIVKVKELAEGSGLSAGKKDIMVETAMCKVFCSDHGWLVAEDCIQIMGGESYMTENRVERMWRDSRINTIVEGANEVMHSFIFAYGSKQLGEWMLSVKNNPTKNIGAGIKIATQLFLGVRPAAPPPCACPGCPPNCCARTLWLSLAPTRCRW